MANKVNYPIPPSHQTFNFGSVTIDSNFDSGNCSHAQKVSNTSYNIWICTDHSKNNYRTWFHFSLEGLNKGITVTFKIKNMQNQSRLLNQGLVPVYRQNDCKQWKRIKQKINTSSIQFNQGWIEWSFKHTMTSNQKVFFAFFYPWSNQQNSQFLNMIQQRCKSNSSIYFHRSIISRTLQGRPIQFLTISSRKGISNKQEAIDDKFLFADTQSSKAKPKAFNCDKKCIVISARVHPGEVPSSHVMTGIIDQLTKDNQVINILRDKVVFYIFPILNPDGVARGHYRVDTNGINLNRCYINPHPKDHSPIYAVKKIIMYLHQNGRYFGFLDLHAHASRKGVFIYGNSTNQLEKQVQTCLFPKILSMNSENFQYQGSNFTQKNMYVKDRGDHVSKQGAGRVAIFKATKNAFSWTLECNYNMNRVTNILEPQNNIQQEKIVISQNQLNDQIIIPYKYPAQKPPTQFYTIQTYRKLGRQICESFCDLLQSNPVSRIQNKNNHFKSIHNLKMNLAIALLRMAPNRFQTHYKKVLYGIQSGKQTNSQIYKRSLEGLYLMIIKKAKIQNLNEFLKNNDRSSIIYSSQVKKNEKKNFVRRSQSVRPQKPAVNSNNAFQSVKAGSVQSQRQNQEFKQLKQIIKTQNQSQNKVIYDSGIFIQQGCNNDFNKSNSEINNKLKSQNSVNGFFSWDEPQHLAGKKVFLHVQEFKLIGINRLRKSVGSEIKNVRAKGIDEYNFRNSKQVKIKFGQLPMIQNGNAKSPIRNSSKMIGSIQSAQVVDSSRQVFGKSLSKQYLQFEDDKL